VDNHGFRYYDPEIGRYLTRDPIGYGDGMNVYLYVGGNPINHIDPLGLADVLADRSPGQSGNDAPSLLTYTPTTDQEKADVIKLAPPKLEGYNGTAICAAPPRRADDGPQLVSKASINERQLATEFNQSFGLNSDNPEIARGTALNILTPAIAETGAQFVSQAGMFIGRELGFVASSTMRFSRVGGAGGEFLSASEGTLQAGLRDPSLYGTRWTTTPTFNPALSDNGLAIGEGLGARVEIGPSAFSSRQNLIETLIHEETHIRLDLRTAAGGYRSGLGGAHK